jgi:hypothetical protein
MSEHEVGNPTTPGVPAVVDRATWQAELDTLRVREKAHTREGDAIADRPTWSSNNDMLCSVSELISASTLRECGHVIH